jgi:hypothetical protein
LVEYAREGDVEGIQILLDQGKDVNTMEVKLLLI